MPLKPLRFRARIYAIGINRCVDVPKRVAARLGSEMHIPVAGDVEGKPIVSTLVPRGGGQHRLYIHSRIWRKLGVDKSDVVCVSLVRDEASREPQVPADILAALVPGSRARRVFDAFTAASRRRFVAWIAETKSAEARTRRIQVGKRRLAERWRSKTKRK